MKYLIFGTIPFEHEDFPSEEEIINKNLFGNNVGNMFFFNAIVKSLLRDGNQLIKYRSGLNVDDFDVGILIHANSIRNGTKEWFENDYKIISNSHIPFVLVCVGADSNPQFQTHLDKELITSIKKCYDLLLERTASIGVRGEFTKQVLIEQVGIQSDKIDVIGCPSVRYFGKNFKKFPRKYPLFSEKLKIAVNFTAYHYDLDEAIYLYKLLKKHSNSFVIFTDKVEADLMFNHTPVPENRRHELLPTSEKHFILRQNRARFLARQDKIMQMMSTFDFSIGSRIHQAIVSILSGCPALLIAHSSRVLEIAQHHNIPYILRTELVEREPSVEELYYRACVGMKDFYESYDEKLLEYTNFLEKNNLSVNPDFF